MKIVTAIGNPYLNEKLKEYDFFEVIGKDIQYQEGILEILEENRDIDVLIISDLLPEEYDFNILINKIRIMRKNIELIVFLKEKNEDTENFLNGKNIYKIYYINDFDFNNFIISFNSDLKSDGEEISKEISDFKNLILCNNPVKENNTNKSIKKVNFNYNGIYKFKKILKNKTNNGYITKNIKNEEELNNVIAITGVFGIGKSIVLTMIANYLAKKEKRVLLLDFDILNSSINTILGIKKYPKKCDINNLASFIIEKSKNFFVLCGIDKILKNDEGIDFLKIKEVLNLFKNEFDFILIDVSSDIRFKYVKQVLTYGNKIIFLIEPNISEIKKANNLLEVFINDWKLDVDKIKIVFNKTNKYQIAESILEEIYSDFSIWGNIKYNEKYELYINKNLNCYIEESKDYEQICNKICSN